VYSVVIPRIGIPSEAGCQSEEQVRHLRLRHESLLEAFLTAVESLPNEPAIHYFDKTFTWAELDRATDILSSLLIARGFEPHDRAALCVQNDPALVLGLVAVWKAGGVAVPLSPMSKTQEFAFALADFSPKALICLDDVYEDVAKEVLYSRPTSVQTVVTVSALDFQTRDDPRMFSETSRRVVADTVDLKLLIDNGGETKSVYSRPGPNDIAVIAPTSGTTGDPKGAMLTHQNLLFSAQTYQSWTGLLDGEPVLAMSPTFHITGLVGAVLLGIVARCPVVLTHRFHPQVTADAIRERRPAFVIAAITAYKALADEPDIVREDLESLRICYSGGLPVKPDEVEDLEQRLGIYIHNAYGQTETASPSHMVPFGQRAPVDEETGTLSIGVPVFATAVAVVGDCDEVLVPGSFGQFVTAGPQVMRGYWQRPDASAAALAGGYFKTGDVGFVSSDGWHFIVDRVTDVINAAGYKIWPYEVELVLTSHRSVREAAVVDIADDYRGQSVRAYVVLHDGAQTSPTELIEYTRERLAAYKYPREVEIVEELPRTATGKLLRRELREQK
jgi:long-chain acyl-CoA synthetase